MPIVNGSDPSLSRPSTTPSVAGATPPTVSSNGTATSSGTTIARGITPIVSGNDVSYPQATEATTNRSVTITSSPTNDAGDIVTVYTSPTEISVSSINQTINNFTSEVAGVSEIVAGNGITISSTGTGGTGAVTINAVTGSFGNIAVLNLNGNPSTVLKGDGTWGAAGGGDYSNSNVVSLLANFGSNTITTTGNVRVGNINATVGLSTLVFGSATATGNPGMSSTSSITLTANRSGTTKSIFLGADGETIFPGNISATNIGNISSIDLTGSSTNVLYGNGVFAPQTGGGSSLGNLEVTGTTITVIDGASQNSILVGNGPAGLTLGLNSVGPAYLNLYANTYDTQTYSTGFGYTTGTYTASEGGGTITLTDATVIETFLNSLSKPATTTSLLINGTDTVSYDGASYGGGTVNLFTTTAPGVDPTDVTSILFNITYQNQFLIDEDNGDYGIYLGDLNFDIRTVRDVNITAGDDLRLESNDIFSLTNNGDISFTTNANSSSFSWAFHNTGVTYFPSLTVDLHNGGNQSGQVLQFGDDTQQVIITGPTPPEEMLTHND